MKTILLGLLLAMNAAAYDLTPKPTPGIFFLKLGGALNEPSLLNNKIIDLGYQHPLFFVFDYQLDAGYFADNAKNAHTGFGSASLGCSINNEGYYVKAFTGPAVVSRTDDHLSSPIEFKTDFSIGLKDRRGVGMGVGYMHFSSAGLSEPNIGRDFVYFQVSIP